jgi:hypothetical protein
MSISHKGRMFASCWSRGWLNAVAVNAAAAANQTAALELIRQQQQPEHPNIFSNSRLAGPGPPTSNPLLVSSAPPVCTFEGFTGQPKCQQTSLAAYGRACWSAE